MAAYVTIFDSRRYVRSDSADVTFLLPVKAGGTNADLSATGGANQFLKQSTVGGNITVGVLGAGDVPDGALSSNVALLNRNAQNFTGSYNQFAQVGIGGVPSFPAHVISTTTPQIVAEYDSTHRAELFHDATNGYVGTKTNTPFRIRTDDTDAIQIDTSQNVVVVGSTVAIHKNGASQRLDIGAVGDTGSTGELRIFAASNRNNWKVGNDTETANALTITPSTAVNGTTFSTPAITVLPAGNVGIGVSPLALLHINGTVRVDGQASTGANTPTLGTNKPGSAATLAPQKWLTINLDNVTYYVPCWI